ncbi:MAG: YfhO family protein, partial [Candidatus Hydrothermarchaeales archaeon]
FILREPSFSELQSLLFSNLLPNIGVFHGFDYMQEIDALGRGSYVVFLGFADRLPPERLYWLLGALNVKYINSFKPLSKGAVTLVQHFPEHPSWLYKLNRVVPRAYIVAREAVEKDPEKILDRLSSRDFDPLKSVILEKSLSIPAKKEFHAKAKIIRYANQEVAIQASLNSSGVLVLTDSFYPGWQVYVDGKEKEMLRANFLFRGVPLSAGEHLVEFRYRPRSFSIGLIISLVTLCGIIVWSVILHALKRGRRLQ